VLEFEVVSFSFILGFSRKLRCLGLCSTSTPPVSASPYAPQQYLPNPAHYSYAHGEEATGNFPLMVTRDVMLSVYRA
jgi:hypothetical protein